MKACLKTALVFFLVSLAGCDSPDEGRSSDSSATTGPAVSDPAASTETDRADATETMALPRLSAEGLTLTGVSAGGYMAQQVHLAHSGMIDGVALIASGPWGCAEGSLSTAMLRCLASADPSLESGRLAARVASLAGQSAIDPLSGLAGDRVWLFAGSLDTTLDPELTSLAAGLYEHWLPPDRIRTVTDVAAAHHFPTLDQGSDCGVSQSPWLGNCGYDAAGEALQFLLGDLQRPSSEPSGKTMELPMPGAFDAGLFETVYLYLPEACATGPACRMHLVLHGCAQSAETIGRAFVDGSGYQRWADTNRLAVVYPQVTASAANPYACWDWWGYSGENFESREGPQVAALMALVERLSGELNQK